MDTIFQRMQTYSARHQLFEKNSSLLLMLSGGGDSVALLHLLVQAQHLGFGSKYDLIVMHVNHQLRGIEADEDEAFVVHLCKEMDLHIEVRNVNVADYAQEHRLNLEDTGRTLRYREAEAYLNELCDTRQQPHSSGRIITAHTRDDRIENFFTRAIYGSGLGGLAGMAPRRGRIIRPLLDIDRTELRRWLTMQEYSWREDPSNQDTSRTRAFIRAHIVPEAEKLRPNFRENLARTMDLVADDDKLLSDMALSFAQNFCLERSKDDHIILDARLMLTLDPTMARRVVRCAITETFEDASRLDASHVVAILEGLDVLRHLIDSGEKVPPKKNLFVRDIPPALRVKINCATIGIARIQD
ncbi:MAG: tRNA lysidine(34) synthetase TilS, partial [Coriobacteriia bacterium]|nr:tRNA lysidine(34) synthetase TilS [Coriobacteriia bacterium]MCL2871065.1 tRNA lysidine(34) synthetase TilS [Coriobacteriia bacterium]